MSDVEVSESSGSQGTDPDKFAGSGISQWKYSHYLFI